MRRSIAVVALCLGLSLPFMGKPVHIDDTNFLMLARGAAADLWRPHAISINWQGTAQPAFDVLSNPPGVAWWLAPWVDAPVWMQHAAMLPWLMLALAGAWRLGRVIGQPAPATLLICASPIAVLATQALTPDLPLLACTLAGVAGLIDRPASSKGGLGWAVLLGAASLFRYSGVALIPLAALWPLLHGQRKRAAVNVGLAMTPIGLLLAHDLHAYGQVHLLAMVDFQGASGEPREVLRKLVAAVAMFGGAACLPVLAWARPRPATIGGLVGAALGAAGVVLSDQSGTAAIATMVAATAGGVSLGGALRKKDRLDLFLTCWLLGGLVFLLRLRFSAARYWLPFFAPAVLLVLRSAHPRLILAAGIATPLLSLGLALDDFELARAQETLAARVAQHGPGLFAGHWGWQHHLESAGWTALEEDAPVPDGVVLAVSAVSWPQAPASGCLRPVARYQVGDRWWGPRVHTSAGAANIHAHMVSARPPVETYAPWSFAGDSLDIATVWTGCAR